MEVENHKIVYDEMLERQEKTFQEEIYDGLRDGMKNMPLIHYVNADNVDIYKQRCEDVLDKQSKTKTSKEIEQDTEHDEVLYLYLNIIQHYDTYKNKQIIKEKESLKINDESIDLDETILCDLNKE